MATNPQITIKNGSYITDHKEYVTFKRQYITRWGVISQIMRQIEKLIGQYNINIAYLDIKSLIQLSEQDQDVYGREDLMSCITNRVQVDAAMSNPMMRFKGPNGPVLAAIKIQTCWRRHKAYSAFSQLKYLMEKATVVQRKYRLYMLKK